MSTIRPRPTSIKDVIVPSSIELSKRGQEKYHELTDEKVKWKWRESEEKVKAECSAANVVPKKMTISGTDDIDVDSRLKSERKVKEKWRKSGRKGKKWKNLCFLRRKKGHISFLSPWKRPLQDSLKESKKRVVELGRGMEELELELVLKSKQGTEIGHMLAVVQKEEAKELFQSIKNDIIDRIVSAVKPRLPLTGLEQEKRKEKKNPWPGRGSLLETVAISGWFNPQIIQWKWIDGTTNSEEKRRDSASWMFLLWMFFLWMFFFIGMIYTVERRWKTIHQFERILVIWFNENHSRIGEFFFRERYHFGHLIHWLQWQIFLVILHVQSQIFHPWIAWTMFVVFSPGQFLVVLIWTF